MNAATCAAAACNLGRLWPVVPCVQFTPGPGNDAITVQHLYSWYHRWGDVILTTEPQVARELPLPSRPLVLTSATRVSPLVQAVRTPAELEVGVMRWTVFVCSVVGVVRPGESAQEAAGDALWRMPGVFTMAVCVSTSSCMAWMRQERPTRHDTCCSLPLLLCLCVACTDICRNKCCGRS